MSAHSGQREEICPLSSPKLIESRTFAATLHRLIQGARDESRHLLARHRLRWRVGSRRGAVSKPRKVSRSNGAEEEIALHIGEWKGDRGLSAGPCRLCRSS